MVYMLVLETKSCGFESRLRHQFADVMELVYISDLKSEFWGFESLHPYHFLALVQWIEQ